MPKCPKDCNKPNCVFFRKATVPAAMRNDEIDPPQNGDFCNMLVVYEATGNVYLFPSDGVPVLLSATNYELLDNLPSINGVTLLGDLTLEDLGISQLVEEEAEERKTADSILQRQIDAITASSDVVDIVGTYEELEEYDTSRLHENDIIKVLADETIGGATAYYRWVNGQWEYIGEEGPYYTKNETDALLDQKMDISTLDDYYTKTETDTLLNGKADVSALAGKQDKLVAGENITIDQATNVISATVPSLTNYYTKQETYSQAEVDSLISGVEADIPTATSQLTNDSGFLTTLPIATDQILGGIKVGSGLSVTSDGTLSATGTSIAVDSALSTTSTNPVENRVITNALNNKANITDIPTVPTNVSAFYNDAGYVTSSTIAQNYYNKTETYNQTEVDSLISGVSADIPTKTSDLTNDGATGTSTYVELNQLAPVATSGSYNDLTDKPTVMTGLVEMSYGEANAWAKFIAAYQAKQIVYCRASSAANPASGSQTRKAFMAYVNNATNPTSVEFQYVRSVSSKTASQPVDQVFIYTLTSSNGGTWTVTTRDMGPKLAQGTNTTVSYSNGTYTISATQPTVPTKTSDLTNDGSDGTSTYVEADELATVATSGSYNDLSNKPTIPAAQVNSDWSANSGVAQILNKPTLATVATSGSYNDLSNKPTIPTVNNATLTIQKNGTTVNTFTANASSNVTADIAVPTKTSDLTNDGADGGSPYVTEADIAPAELGGEGNAIYIEGTTDCSAIGTHILGNIEQDGTPTPSAHVPIQTVTGRQTVTVAGKNLLRNAYQATQTISGVTITSNADGTITANGTATGTINFFINGSNTQYNISAGTYTLSTGTNDSDTTYFMIVDKSFSGEWSSRYASTRTITVPSGGGTIAPRIVIRPNTTLNNVVFKPMFERGSTATTFEPYKAQDYEINLGKNLFDKDNVNQLAGSLNSNNKYEAGGANRIVYIPCEPNTTYTVQKRNDGDTNRFVVATSNSVLENADPIYGRIEDYNAKSITITTNASARFLNVLYYRTAETTLTEQQVLDSIQIEKGSIASSYSAYFTPIELCKIGTYQDRIYKDGEKWYLHKEIGKVVLNGSENWSLINSGTSNFYYNLPVFVTPKDQDIMPVSDYFVGTPITNGNTSMGLWITNAGTIRARKETEQTLADFKTWLGTVLPSVYYVLATPTTTEITNLETLRGLTELDDAYGYESITNVTVSTPNTVPALLSVSTYAGGAIPAATNNRPGVVMIGDGLSVDECGKVSSGYYPIDIDVGYDSDFSNWDDTSKELLGPIISIAKDSLGEYRNQICGIAIPNATFTRRDNGQSLSIEEVYNLVDGDARVRLYNLPFIYAFYNGSGGALSRWDSLGRLGRVELSAKVEWERTDEWTEYGTRYGGEAPTTMACNLGAYIERREVVGNGPEYAIYLKFIRQYRP